MQLKQERDLRRKIVTGEWSVRECDGLFNEVADTCDRMKLQILKNDTFAIDGFKIVAENTITISEIDLIVIGEVPNRQKIRKILFF